VIVYGRQAVREALRGRRDVRRVWATEPAARADWLRGVAVERTSSAGVEALAESREHQGICAEAGPYPYADADELLTDPEALVLCLDQVQDPGNLGAICRVAECAGAAGAVIPERGAAQMTPAVCPASAGAVEHLWVARVRNLADWLAAAKRAGRMAVRRRAGGRPPLRAARLPGPRGARARLRGPRAAPASRPRLRRARRAARARAGRVAQRLGRGPPLRNLDISRPDPLTCALGSQILRAT
jgi:23S rRNA (guanosine2251-2'-O)-methyltransferase